MTGSYSICDIGADLLRPTDKKFNQFKTTEKFGVGIGSDSTHLESLAEYTTIAKKLIAKYLRFAPLDYNDILARTIYILVRSDISWQKSDKKYTKTFMRLGKFRYFLRTYFRKAKCIPVVNSKYICNVYRKEQSGEKINFEEILKCAGLSEKQKETVRMHLCQNMTFEEIARENNSTKQAAFNKYTRAIKKLRICLGVTNEHEGGPSR